MLFPPDHRIALVGCPSEEPSLLSLTVWSRAGGIGRGHDHHHGGGVGGETLPGLPAPGGFPGARPDPDDEPAVIEAVPVEPIRRK